MIDIIINIEGDGLTEELLDKAKEIIIGLANRFIEDKDIKVNIQIIIPNDFSKELTEFQEKNNLPVEHTNNSYAVASAKTLKIKNNDKTNYTIFFNKGMFVAIIKHDDFGITHLYHELSHVYYNEIIGNKYKQIIKDFELSKDLKINCNVFSYISWEEYFVSRELTKYLIGNTDCYMEILTDYYKEVEKDLEKEIFEYRYHADINKIFDSSREKITLLATYMSYSLGMIAGLVANFEDVSKSSFDDRIKQEVPKIFDIWNTLYDYYDSIYQDFPNLNLDKLTDISKQILKMYECFGIYIKLTEDNQLYIDIPL